MVKVTLTQGFADIPVGQDQELFVKKVVFDEKWQKIGVRFADVDGATLNETFALMKENGAPNQAALGAFSNLYKAIFGGKNGDDVDIFEIDQHWVIGDVYDQTDKRTGKVYRHVKNYRRCERDEAAGDGDDGLFS